MRSASSNHATAWMLSSLGISTTKQTASLPLNSAWGHGQDEGRFFVRTWHKCPLAHFSLRNVTSWAFTAHISLGICSSKLPAEGPLNFVYGIQSFLSPSAPNSSTFMLSTSSKVRRTTWWWTARDPRLWTYFLYQRLVWLLWQNMWR